MTTISHKSADASHYSKSAEHYDAFNEQNSKLINNTIENILKKYGVETVLDLTCGTGSQVFWLAKRRYKVTGSDFNANMLKIARSKAEEEKLDITFLEGDMRTTKVGKFDAVITIFNAVGHLTKLDFEKAMRNVHSNLKDGGLYVFDINNLGYLLKDNNITKLTIDWQKIEGDTKLRDIQYSTIDDAGILASHTVSYMWKGSSEPRILRGSQTLQVYSAKQLKEMLQRSGFEVLDQCGIDGSRFDETESESIVMIAQKQ